MTELGRWIDKQLEESDRTRDDLAKAMGIDVGTLGEIISGSIERPPDARLEALAEFFSVSVDVVKALISGKRLDEGAEVRSGDGQPNSTDRPLASLACVAPTVGGEGLRENLIVPVGRVESLNGAFIFNEESAELVLAAFRKHQTAIPIDIAHESLSNRRAKAAGWIESLVFDQARGLVGLVSWTAETRDMLHADEFRYLSPVVLVRKSDGVVVELESAAVTNRPAIPGMQKLAASRDSVGAGGTETVRVDNMEHAEGTPAMGLMTKVRDMLGMKDSSVEQVLEAVLKIVAFIKTVGKGGGEADPAAATPEANSRGNAVIQPNAEGDGSLAQTPDVVVGQIAALLEVEVGSNLSTALLAILAKIKTLVSGSKAMSAEVTESAGLRRNLVELQTQIAERDADDALRPFILSGHINPRDVVDVAFCRKMAMGDSEMLAHQMKIRTPYVQTGMTDAPDAPATHGRSATIANAKQEYGADPSIGKMTSQKAYVNLKLHEAEQGPLTGDEAKLIVG